MTDPIAVLPKSRQLSVALPRCIFPFPMNSNRVAELCHCFKEKRVIVIGDVMLDHYLNGEVGRISPEAPVPVLDFCNETYLPGGAANVARNLASLGAVADLFGVIGHDNAGSVFKKIVRDGGIRLGGLIMERGRPTTVKTRIMAKHQQMMRIDHESRLPLVVASKRRLLRALRHGLKGAAAIIVADYAKGVVDQDMLDEIFVLARNAKVPVCIDPKPNRLLRMKGCALLTPNRKEAFELAGMRDEGAGSNPVCDLGLRSAMGRIQRLYAPGILLVTLGEGGMLVLERGGSPRHLPTVAQAVYDVSGAGDTVIASFALARIAGADAAESATFANIAAGIVVGKLGAASVSPKELIKWLSPGNAAMGVLALSGAADKKQAAVRVIQAPHLEGQLS